VKNIMPKEGNRKKNYITVNASGGNGGVFGGGGGGGMVYVGDITEKNKIKYQDKGEDGPGHFETTHKLSKYRVKCWTNTVILSPGQCKYYRSHIVSHEPQN
jgi:hypothetical protein